VSILGIEPSSGSSHTSGLPTELGSVLLECIVVVNRQLLHFFKEETHMLRRGLCKGEKHVNKELIARYTPLLALITFFLSCKNRLNGFCELWLLYF
jgi:hypothetical protein